MQICAQRGVNPPSLRESQEPLLDYKKIVPEINEKGNRFYQLKERLVDLLLDDFLQETTDALIKRLSRVTKNKQRVKTMAREIEDNNYQNKEIIRKLLLSIEKVDGVVYDFTFFKSLLDELKCNRGTDSNNAHKIFNQLRELRQEIVLLYYDTGLLNIITRKSFQRTINNLSDFSGFVKLIKERLHPVISLLRAVDLYSPERSRRAQLNSLVNTFVVMDILGIRQKVGLRNQYWDTVKSAVDYQKEGCPEDDDLVETVYSDEFWEQWSSSPKNGKRFTDSDRQRIREVISTYYGLFNAFSFEESHFMGIEGGGDPERNAAQRQTESIVRGALRRVSQGDNQDLTRDVVEVLILERRQGDVSSIARDRGVGERQIYNKKGTIVNALRKSFAEEYTWQDFT